MAGNYTFSTAFAVKNQADEFHKLIWRFTGMDAIRQHSGSTWSVHIRGISHVEHGYAQTVARRIASGLVGDAVATCAGFPA